MTALAARWRCAGCGRTVAGATVALEAGVPFGECPRCRFDDPALRVPVLFERIAPAGTHGPRDPRPVGADVSLFELPEVATASFLELIRKVPAGERFSVNTLRSRLDALEVPPRLRGRLFGRACELGLARPLYVEAGGLRVAAREPSSGSTANLASVRIYERTGEEQ